MNTEDLHIEIKQAYQAAGSDFIDFKSSIIKIMRSRSDNVDPITVANSINDIRDYAHSKGKSARWMLRACKDMIEKEIAAQNQNSEPADQANLFGKPKPNYQGPYDPNQP